MQKERKIETILSLVFIVLFVIAMVHLASGEVQASSSELKLIDATAYYDSYGNGHGADGRKLVEDLTIAGRVQDLGKTAVLYDEDMMLIGIYEFRDVGYGQPTGKGQSSLLKGKSIGTIENGTCVDIYMKTKKQCTEWGKRKVYIQYINAKG